MHKCMLGGRATGDGSMHLSILTCGQEWPGGVVAGVIARRIWETTVIYTATIFALMVKFQFCVNSICLIFNFGLAPTSPGYFYA